MSGKRRAREAVGHIRFFYIDSFSLLSRLRVHAFLSKQEAMFRSAAKAVVATAAASIRRVGLNVQRSFASSTGKPLHLTSRTRAAVLSFSVAVASTLFVAHTQGATASAAAPAAAPVGSASSAAASSADASASGANAGLLEEEIDREEPVLDISKASQEKIFVAPCSVADTKIFSGNGTFPSLQPKKNKGGRLLKR